MSENSYWRSTHAAIHLKGAAVRSMVEPNLHVVFSVDKNNLRVRFAAKFIHVSPTFHIYLSESVLMTSSTFHRPIHLNSLCHLKALKGAVGVQERLYAQGQSLTNPRR